MKYILLALFQIIAQTPETGAIRGYDNLYTIKDGEKYRNMVQPEESDLYLQDQDNSGDETSGEEELTHNPDIEVKHYYFCIIFFFNISNLGHRWNRARSLGKSSTSGRETTTTT